LFKKKVIHNADKANGGYSMNLLNNLDLSYFCFVILRKWRKEPFLKGIVL